jgi:hypothetical protein
LKTVQINNAEHLVLIEYSGVVTDGDLNLELKSYSRAGSKFSFVVDLSLVEELKVTSDGIRGAAKSWGPEQVKCAVIAPGTAAFGLARMYEMHWGNAAMVVFRDIASACEWLCRQGVLTAVIGDSFKRGGNWKNLSP